jgi:transcriptional regulator with XRE-family HTH domain
MKFIPYRKLGKKKLAIAHKIIQIPPVMSNFKETTAANLKAIRAERRLNQEDIADILGITQTAVSKIESGARTLGSSEKKLLDWHFFRIIPFRIHTSGADPKNLLDFDEAEYRIIGRLARREGITEEEWIVSRIRSYLEYLKSETPSLLKVAEEEPTYRTTPKEGNAPAYLPKAEEA